MEILTSHKFIAALIALIVVFFGNRAGLTAEQVTEAVAVLISYIVGRGLAANASKSK